MFRPVPTYTYSPLPDGFIRLLRLMPNSNEHAPIEVQLVDYHLVDSGRGTHLYEALSYVWGSPEKPQFVDTGRGYLAVTENLHAALLRLRDRSLHRIIWADAICINQDDTEERGHQVRSMAKIYARASRVIVWLEEPATSGGQLQREAFSDGDRALEVIGIAAGGQSKTFLDEVSQQSVLRLLQHSWFRRIWVLQEVAAARHILVMCNSIEIDGYAFCVGLNALNLTAGDPATRSRVRSAAYLIKGAVLRPKYAPSSPDRFSLHIHSLGELIDIYHNREATDPRDKVYALLGMSSAIPAGLDPDYNIPWKDLLRRLVRSLVGEQASVKTWDDDEIAVITSQVYVLGKVSSVPSDKAWNDSQDLNIILRDMTNRSERWTLQASAKSVQEGDVVCFLEGASQPTIIRPFEDYCAVITINIAPTTDQRPEGAAIDWQDRIRQATALPRTCLLVWDWQTRQVPEHVKTEWGRDLQTAARFEDIGLLLQDAERYEGARRNFRQAAQIYEKISGRDNFHSLRALGNLASTHRCEGGRRNIKKAEKLEAMADIVRRNGAYASLGKAIVRVARSFDGEVMAFLLDRRGSEREITDAVLEAAAGTIRNGEEVVRLLLDRLGGQIKVTEAVLEAAARNHSSGEKVIRRLLDQWGHQTTVSEEMVCIIARNFDGQVMELLFDRWGDQITVSEQVIEAAARNPDKGEEVIRVLLDQRGDQITVSEEVMGAAAGNCVNGEEIIRLLLDRLGDQITITEVVLKTAVRNPWCGKEVVQLLLDRRGNEITVAEEVIKAAARSKKVMELLLDERGDEITITEDVLKAAAGQYKGEEVMRLLLDRRGDEIAITEEVIKAAARCHKGGEVMKLLLDRRGDEITITDEVIKAAARWPNVMELLLDQWGDEITISEDVLKAAAGNYQGRQAMKLLLGRRGDEIVITEEVVKAAAGCLEGEKTIEFLLDERGGEITITEDVVKAAAASHSGKKVMELLLDRRGDQITITQEVVKAAATSHWGQQAMELLLDQRGDQITITEEVVKAAAGNELHGKNIMMLLLDRRGAATTASITEEAFKAAAACGQYRVLDLLSHHTGISIQDEWRQTAKLYNAAKSGNTRRVEELILAGAKPDMRSNRGETPLWVAAYKAHEAIVKLLARRPDVNVNSRSIIGQSPLFLPARLGKERIVSILLEAGADPNLMDKNGDTAITLARERGHERIVKMLERRTEHLLV
ncbi:hypothetical protein QBC47DRAFT_337161 [Echria macrotheca]|uniref:Heterokaryon incompatibility domain-containing protein n=1 Tax=Echria macrotheca TaxID=438768 RepID=A0AAJ0BLD1_9PEZI|nr:hypothetical protein QBC47DRAFT_337161 [Echria macrotheca]